MMGEWGDAVMRGWGNGMMGEWGKKGIKD